MLCVVLSGRAISGEEKTKDTDGGPVRQKKDKWALKTELSGKNERMGVEG